MKKIKAANAMALLRNKRGKSLFTSEKVLFLKVIWLMQLPRNFSLFTIIAESNKHIPAVYSGSLFQKSEVIIHAF